MNRSDFTIVLALVALFCIWAKIIAGWSICNANGGHYVRGLFWMECVR